MSSKFLQRERLTCTMINYIAALKFRTTVETIYWSVEAKDFNHAVVRLREHFGDELAEIVTLGISNHVSIAPGNHLKLDRQISQEQFEAEEKMCQWVKELALMGVSRQTIIEQVDATLGDLKEQLLGAVFI